MASLPDASYARLSPHLETVTLPRGRLLHKAHVPLSEIYFPTEGIVSLLYVEKDGASTEIALVGSEGLVGLPALFGSDTTPNNALVQCEGHGFRLPRRVLHDEFVRDSSLQQVVLRYALALISQMGQTAVCNRHHSLDQQLCRWLLLSLDRLPSNELSMTQSLIADMLGVRREGVTEAAGRLQANGLIKYRRGRITVLDRPGLEARVCECYAVVRNEFDRLLP